MYNSALFNSRYSIVKQIGEGGMSSVFLCNDKRLSKKWAVKKISLRESDKSFALSEINLLKSLDYYMFPRITDAFKGNNEIAIVTDYIEGENLESYLCREGGLPVNVALNYFEELLHALKYLHSRSPAILYLDMKPANIMLRPDGQIRLIDFGIAGSILLKSRSVGTIGYSPPEQYLPGIKLTEKADVFSLGMTLYTMITAKKPSKDINVQIERIRADKAIPGTIKKIILKCINADLKDRASVDELIKMLSETKGRGRGLSAVLVVTAFVIATFLAVAFFLADYTEEIRLKRSEMEMVNSIAEYMEDGEYTEKALKIICGYIDGNFLDEQSREKYTYEVAKNYFEIQKDYANAKIYFLRLDEEKYPEVKEYISICDKMRSFSDSDEELIRIMKGEVNKKE